MSSLLLVVLLLVLRVHAQGDDVPLVPVEFAALVRPRQATGRKPVFLTSFPLPLFSD